MFPDTATIVQYRPRPPAGGGGAAHRSTRRPNSAAWTPSARPSWEEQAKAEKEAREKLAAEQAEAKRLADEQAEREAETARQARCSRSPGTYRPVPVAAPAAANVVPLTRPAAQPADTGARVKLGTSMQPSRRCRSQQTALGFPHVGTDKAAKLYRAADLPAIYAAMVAHIEAVQAKQAAA